MEIGARNQLKGTVRSVETGAIMAEVVVDVGDSADGVGDHEGIRRAAGARDRQGGDGEIIKATEVMLATG